MGIWFLTNRKFIVLKSLHEFGLRLDPVGISAVTVMSIRRPMFFGLGANAFTCDVFDAWKAKIEVRPES